MPEEKIRVVHLVQALEVGGLEVVVCDLIRGCDRRIFAPFVVCLGSEGELARLLRPFNVPVLALNIHGRSLPVRVAKLARELRRINPEIVHTHNTAPHINAALAKALVAIPALIHTKHGRNIHIKPNSSIFDRFAVHVTDQIVAVSQDCEEMLVSKQNVATQQVRVIWNGVDTNKFQHLGHFGRPFAPKAIHVARLNPIKNQAMMLQAVRKVVDILPEFQLDIIGDGPVYDDLERLRTKLGLESSVAFLGMRDDVSQLLPRSEIFLLSSDSEGICIALLEAMSCGLAAVVTDVGGNGEVVEQDRTGLLVPSNEPTAFANAILKLCTTPSLARDMGQRGRERVEKCFSLSSMIQGYERLYLDVLASKGIKSDDRFTTGGAARIPSNASSHLYGGSPWNERQGRIVLTAFESGWKKRKSLQYWRQLQQSQWESLESLRHRQIFALQRLLHHASKYCPYYAELWSCHGIAVSDFHALDDLSRWPLLYRENVRQYRHDLRASTLQDEVISKSTGGSSGVPLQFDLNLDSNDRRMAAWHRGYSWAGAAPGTRQVYLWGVALGDRTWRARLKDHFYQAWLYRRRVLNTFDLNENTMSQYLRRYNRYRPDALVAYTNPLYSFARWLDENKLTPYSPHSIVVGAEKLHGFQRQLIERVFQAPVFETYGSREFMLIGAECDQHEGLHLTMEHLLVEVVDDEGQPVPAGQEGQVVVTDLYNYGMPFIRYVTGDRAIAGFTQCSCGRGLPLLRKVVGRQLDILTTPAGRQIPGEFFPHLIKDFPPIRRFQVEQCDPGHIIVRLIVDRATWSSAWRERLIRETQRQLDDSVELTIEEVDNIPLTPAGKLQVVINRCTKSPLAECAATP